MTNGEKIKEIFPNIIKYGNILIDDTGALQKNILFDDTWWNAEYKEPTTKNNLGVDCISRTSALDSINWAYNLSDAYQKINDLPSVIPQEPRVDFEELKRKILMEVDGGTDDAWLAYGEVCNRISNTIDEFVSDMRGEQV